MTAVWEQEIEKVWDFKKRLNENYGVAKKE